MDITLTDSQSLIFETARTFAREALQPRQIRELEGTANGFDGSTWQEIVRMGWTGAVFPSEYGGSDLGLLELALIIEALGQGAIPSPIFSTVVEGGLLLLEAGSPAQRTLWLPRIVAGDAIVTLAAMEPGGGFAPGEIRTEITCSSDGYSVTGTKLFVRDAGIADAIVCLGSDRRKRGALTLLVVPADAPGVSKRRLWAAGGEALWEVKLDAVRVGHDATLGPPGEAWPHIRKVLLRGAALKSAELVGIGQAALDLTTAYANSRIQFGRAIGTFQAVQRHCADMFRDVTVSRLLAWQAALKLAEGRDGDREAAMAKAKASDVIPAVTRTAHQIHGAFGYYRDYPLELYYHRAMAAAATYGDAAHQRRALARLMCEDMDRFRGDFRHELPVHYL
jgi:alkylation response protein AidB-like acyl-CoA dehydrogenase